MSDLSDALDAPALSRAALRRAATTPGQVLAIVCVGIVLVTILGEPCRMLILRQDKAASV